MTTPRTRSMLSALLTVLSISALLVLDRTSAPAASAAGSRTGAMSCSGPLTMVLRPDPIPPASASWNGSTARDIPPGPLIDRFPLYGGAVPSSAAMPAHAVIGLPPAYRKAARAEFQVPAGYQAVSAWYRTALTACRLTVDETMPLQQHGGPRYMGLGFSPRDGLARLTLVFRPLAAQSTAVLYVAQELDLPPRPAASFLHGPFTRVDVDYRSGGVIPASNRHIRFTITWPATIARLVTAINAPSRIWVPIGSGGAVIFTQSAVLSFVREDGGARRVYVGGDLDLLIVGHSRRLVDPDGSVIKLVARIVNRRCPHAGSCG